MRADSYLQHLSYPGRMEFDNFSLFFYLIIIRISFITLKGTEEITQEKLLPRAWEFFEIKEEEDRIGIY